ncbi:MAG: serine/threonine-protein kinase [Opitutaceae bacterium]
MSTNGIKSGRDDFEGPTMVGGGRGREAGARPRLAIGELFGPYRVASFLGRGGIGEVFEVEHEILQKRFAMKLLLASTDSPEARARFIREAQVMAALEHDHIIRVDDFGETDGKVWLRMELAEGVPRQNGDGAPMRTLAEWMAERAPRVPEADARAALVQILDALEFAHASGVVHRDLKPGNILLDRTGRLKLADFGLVQVVGERWMRARHDSAGTGSEGRAALDDATTVAHGGGTEVEKAIVGTWEYMSPEQKAGEAVDARSDLYATGLIAFRLLTGERALAMEQPSELAPGLNPGWDVWMRRAVASRPERRFASAAGMRAALPSTTGLKSRAAHGDSPKQEEPGASDARARESEAGAPVQAVRSAEEAETPSGFARVWRSVSTRLRNFGRTNTHENAGTRANFAFDARSDQSAPPRLVADNPAALKAIKRFEKLRTGRLRAALLNFFLPGLGSILRGRPVAGIIFAAAAIAIADYKFWWSAGAVAMLVAFLDSGGPPLSADDRRLARRARRYQLYYAAFAVLALLVLAAGAVIVLAELGHVDAPNWLPRPAWTRSILADLAVMAGLFIVTVRASAMLWSIVVLNRALRR